MFQPFLRFWVKKYNPFSVDEHPIMFQPFLRFWNYVLYPTWVLLYNVSTLLEILALLGDKRFRCFLSLLFQPFLRFWSMCDPGDLDCVVRVGFNPSRDSGPSC